MKYRFRKIHSSEKRRHIDLYKLRFAGKNTLRILRPLPEPIEAIRLEDNRQRLRPLFLLRKVVCRIIKYARLFAGQLSSEIRGAARRLARLCKRIFSSVRSFILKRTEERRKKKINSLPVLFGAAVSCALVSAVTASYILLSLFLPYAKSYTSLIIPSFRGMRLEDISLEDSRLNLLIEYENNPDVADGVVISQTPAAGVTRKIYENGGFCNIYLTVSKQTLPKVPDTLVGLDLRDASLSLLRCGLSYTVTEKYSSLPQGKVISCTPSEGEQVTEGKGVTLTVSIGERSRLTSAPSLIGLTESEAIFRAKSSSLQVGEVTYVRSDKKLGTVISQSPSPYTSVAEGESISFTVSAGAEFSVPTVPDLYGMTVEEATDALLRVGLTVSSVYSISSVAKNRTVIFQSPIAGTPITSSITSVELHISN